MLHDWHGSDSNIVLIPCRTKCINLGNVVSRELLSHESPRVARKTDFHGACALSLFITNMVALCTSSLAVPPLLGWAEETDDTLPI